VSFSARELPDKPSVYRAEKKLARLCTLARTGNFIEYPFDFGSGEICVHRQARFFSYVTRVTCRLYLLADFRGTAALPNDGIAHGLARFTAPYNGCFALVGYAYSRYFLGLYAGK
jgi:hypothetical protein